jgi:ribosomal protein S18 acetylase RimI-like enzyme
MQHDHPTTITLRPADLNDEALLYQLYAGARAEEVGAWGWDSAQQEAFLSLQFRAQQAHYSEYPNADHRIILANGRPIGRLFVSELEDEFRLVDIALLPEHRNAGIGRTLIRKLLDQARLSGKAVRLHVEKTNRAQRLYERLGFAEIGDAGSHLFMEWRAIEKGDEK